MSEIQRWPQKLAPIMPIKFFIFFRIKVRTILAQSYIDDSAYGTPKIGMRVTGRMRSFSFGYF